MIKETILSIIFFLILLLIPYIVMAGVVLEPKYSDPQVDWIDPNTLPQNVTDTYTSSNGLTCKNAVFQVYVGDIRMPARKCQLPDGAWATMPF